MSEQKHTHTPGPWTYDNKSGWINADQCCARGPMHVADIRGWGHLTGGGHGAHGMPRLEAVEIQDANARLICAAPDLLEALEYVMSAHGEQLHDAFDMAQKAIAKAKG